MNNIEEKKDYIWLDYVRVIGIVLVVFGHILQTVPTFHELKPLKGLWNMIYLFHMPLFFIASGFLHSTQLAHNQRNKSIWGDR